MADVTLVAVRGARHETVKTGDTVVWPGAAGNVTRPGAVMLGKLASVNLNSTADQAITLASANWIPVALLMTNVSTSLAASAAAGGVYTAASKGGTAIVGAAQGYTALTGAAVVLSLTLAVTDRQTVTTIYVSLTTAHGSAATADLYVFGYPLD